MVSSCNDGTSYNKSADVHQQGWMPADTLSFGFNVCDTIIWGEYNYLETNRNYGLSLSIRYSNDYSFVAIPLHVKVGKKSYSVNLKPSRHKTWGSLMQDEFDVTGMSVAFADTGMHSIMIYPDTILTGICSVGVDVR